MSDEKKWICEYCTYENWPSAIKCTLCRGAKPAQLITNSKRASDADSVHSESTMAEGNKSPDFSEDIIGGAKWNCSECTYLNWPRAVRCTQCLTPRRPGETNYNSEEDIPLTRDPDCSPAAIKWACKACTYENWPKSLKCVLCHTPRNETVTQTEGGATAAESATRLPRSQSNSPELLGLDNRIQPNNRTQSPQSQVARSPNRPTSPPAVRQPNNKKNEASPTNNNNQEAPSSSNNAVNEDQRMRQLRKCLRDADWRWLNACLSVVNGDVTPVEAYLSQGGDPARQLTHSEVALLNRPSAFDIGHTLVHLAIRFGKQDLLALLLANTEPASACKKLVPCHVCPSIAADISRHISASLRQRKSEFTCYFMPELVTFTLPAEIDDLPSEIQELLFAQLLDRDVQKELEEESPIINWNVEITDRLGSRLYALWNRTCGNCLLDSVLQSTWGIFDSDNSLRRTLADSLNDASHCFYPRWREYESMQAHQLHFSLDEAQWHQDWLLLRRLASEPGAPLEQLHIFALAHILRRPIIVYGVKFVKSFRGETLGYARFEGVYLPLLWEPSFCWKSPVALGYTRGHFSALVAMEPYPAENDDLVDGGAVGCDAADGAANVIYLPLITSDGKLLPIHFLTGVEMGREEELLKQWLDVCVTESGILAAQQQHSQRKPLLVAHMADEWINHYRRQIIATTTQGSRPQPRLSPTANNNTSAVVGNTGSSSQVTTAPSIVVPLRDAIIAGQGYSTDGDSDEE